MALDPDCVRVHELYRKAGRPPLETLSPAEARSASRRGRDLLQPDPPAMAEIRNLSCPGPAGPIPLRLYRPPAADATAILPVLVYYHGGGWVIGDLDSHDTLCRQLAAHGGFAVVSVDYRLAPEHVFPAAVDDCFVATRWVADNALDLGIDANRLGVGGDSAGGNLAAVVAVLARDAAGPLIRHQLLIYPATERTPARASYDENAEILPLTRAAMIWFWNHYAPAHTAASDWRVAPALVPSLVGVPPAHVVTAGHDVLRDEGLAFADRLSAANVSVTTSHFPGQIHGFFTMGKIIREANVAVADAATAVKAALG